MRMHVTLSMFFYLMCCCLGTVVTFSCRILFVCFLLLFFFIECLAIDECIVSTIFTWKFKIKRQRFHVAVLHWGWKKQEKKSNTRITSYYLSTKSVCICGFQTNFFLHFACSFRFYSQDIKCTYSLDSTFIIVSTFFLAFYSNVYLCLIVFSLLFNLSNNLKQQREIEFSFYSVLIHITS